MDKKTLRLVQKAEDLFAEIERDVLTEKMRQEFLSKKREKNARKDKDAV